MRTFVNASSEVINFQLGVLKYRLMPGETVDLAAAPAAIDAITKGRVRPADEPRPSSSPPPLPEPSSTVEVDRPITRPLPPPRLGRK